MIKAAKIALLALIFVHCAPVAQGPAKGAPEQANRTEAKTAPSGKAKTSKAKSKSTASANPSKSTAADRQSVEVTIYNSNLGLVKEQRGVSVPAGEGELQFVDVAAQINPVTVHIKPLSNPGDFAVLEQNYEYDLISHAKLMDKYVGKQIKIIDNNEYQDRKDVIEATLLSAANGEVYKIDDEIYLGHPGIKVLPELPGNLISRPTLSWIYHSRAAREYQLEVSYLTAGMNWNADYILAVADGKSAAGLSGWVTVDNKSGAAYEGAKLKLVAGEVNRAPQNDFRARKSVVGIGYGSGYASASSGFEQSQMFEYHIYDLQRPTTIKENQTKQISLMDAQGVNVVKEYITTPSLWGDYYLYSRIDGAAKQPVTAYLSFKNTKENKLGDPLPAGVVRIYTADAQGRQQFIGEDRITHTPKDEEVRLKVGEAFDIVAERTQMDFKQKTSRVNETEWMISVRNRKDEDVTVKVQENAGGQWSITESTHKHVKMSATMFRFDVPVAKGQEVVVKYKIKVEN